MIVLLDVDGPCADLVGHAIAVARLPITPDDHVNYDDLPRYPGVRELFGDYAFWQSLPVVAGAIAGVDRIRTAGHEVVFVTAPWRYCRGWADARRDWLASYFAARAADVIVAERKELVRGDVLIDDRPETLESWVLGTDANVQAMLYRMAHNAAAHSRWPAWRWDRLPGFLTRR